MNLVLGQIFIIFLLFAVYSTLEKFFALNPEQKIFRSGWKTDLAHLFFNRFLIDGGSFIVFVILAVSMKPFVIPRFQTLIALQPFWLQFLEAVTVANFCGYWSHRLSHEIPFLWKFHSVHHSSEKMDWLASARNHPFDEIFNRAVIFVPLYYLGFTKETFGAYLTISVFIAIFNHSNTRFSFPVLRWFVVTPFYHHWHHSNHSEARNKNFAGQFPFFDWIFGTLYLPKNQKPRTYGVGEAMPNSYAAQMIFPFRKV